MPEEGGLGDRMQRTKDPKIGEAVGGRHPLTAEHVDLQQARRALKGHHSVRAAVTGPGGRVSGRKRANLEWSPSDGGAELRRRGGDQVGDEEAVDKAEGGVEMTAEHGLAE
jgi:hypothetical protein